jgi:hypothetical protein
MDRFNKKIIALIIVLVVVDLGIFGIIKYQSRDKTTRENVEITKVDLVTKDGFAAVLSAFPNGIPFEFENITESFTGNYVAYNVVQSGISYTSLKSRESLYSTYKNFVDNNGFVIDKENSNEQLGTLFASKDNDDFSIVISNQEGKRLVQLGFTERK